MLFFAFSHLSGLHKKIRKNEALKVWEENLTVRFPSYASQFHTLCRHLTVQIIDRLSAEGFSSSAQNNSKKPNQCFKKQFLFGMKLSVYSPNINCTPFHPAHGVCVCAWHRACRRQHTQTHPASASASSPRRRCVPCVVHPAQQVLGWRWRLPRTGDWGSIAIKCTQARHDNIVL